MSKSASAAKALFPAVVKAETGVEVVSEYRFHPTRRWRFDYCILDSKLAIECDGGVYSNGRHTRGSGFVKDMEKLNEATRLGYKVIRVTPQQLCTAYTIDLIKDLLK
jgi:very-short-patch-repair endonuclease